MQNDHCPVCGNELDFYAWEDDSPSHEICPCCGVQFGYDDAIRLSGSADQVMKRYEELRHQWMANGMKWWSKNPAHPCPENWDPKKQLLNIGVKI